MCFETWLNDNISSSELLLDNYTIYRSDRKQDAENNTHGGAMIAIKNSLASEKLSTDHPDCSLTCRLEVNKLSLFISVFYNPPKGSGYRYTQEDFGTLLSALPKNSTAITCGDLNFPNTNCHNFSSEDTGEQEVLELFESNFFIQSVGFNTRENNILDVAFYQIWYVHFDLDEKFTKTFNCSDHKAISLLVECPHTEMKPTMRNFWSFGRANYSEVSEMIKIADFKSLCYANINNMCKEMYDFFDKVAQRFPNGSGIGNLYHLGLHQVRPIWWKKWILNENL